MGEKHFDIEALQVEAKQINQEADTLKKKGLVKSAQEGADVIIIKEQQIEKLRKEYAPTEQKYFKPEQELDTDEYIKFLYDRDLKIQKQAKENLSGGEFKSNEEYIQKLEEEIHKLKYFPVLFISAPHMSEKVSGAFPGEPTPLMYATSALDGYLRNDTFPANTSPEVTAMMNQPIFDEQYIRELEDRIKQEKPRVVGISNTSEGHFFAGKIAEIIKKHSPDTFIILGGSHEDGVNAKKYLDIKNSSAEDKKLAQQYETLEDKRVRHLFDMVIAGDAPYALVEVFKTIANNKNKSNQEIIEEILKRKDDFQNTEGVGTISVKNKEGETERLLLSGELLEWDRLPIKFRGKLTSQNYYPLFQNEDGKPVKTAQIMSQFGCKYKCIYCVESKRHSCGQPSIEKTLQEIEIMVKDYEYGAFFFDDSTFTQDEDHTNKLLDGILELKQRENIDFKWGCQTAFADIPNKQLLEKMKQAGCTYIYFGFEQLEEKMSNKQKQTGRQNTEQILQWCKEVDIEVGVSLQFGLNKTEDFTKTIDFVADLYERKMLKNNSISLNINTPYVGTRQWDIMKDKPDFNTELVRHPRLESANQLSSLTFKEVSDIYKYAHERIGDGLNGVEFQNEELQLVASTLEDSSKDFYFDDDQYEKYLLGEIEGLHLNHASISNRPNELTEFYQWEPKGPEAASVFMDSWITTQAREEAAKFVNVPKEGVIFARNTTEATKLISLLAGLEKGDRVLLTNAENVSIKRVFELNMDHSNSMGKDSWSSFPSISKTFTGISEFGGRVIAEPTGVKTDTINVINENIDNIYTYIANNLTPETKCFVISHVIRDTGEELPVKEICDFVRKKKKEINPNEPDIFIIVDGAQALGNLPHVDFASIGCDAYLGTPHKTMASTVLGLGFFNPDNPIIKKNLLKLNNLFWQDRQIIINGMFDPSLGVKPNVEHSTQNMYGDISGFKFFMDRLKKKGYADGNFEQIAKNRRELKKYFRKLIAEITSESKLTITEVENGTDFIYSFNISGIDNREFVKALSEQGIFVSYIDRTKLQKHDDHHPGDGVIRVSFSVDNTKEEIDQYRDKIKSALAVVVKQEKS